MPIDVKILFFGATADAAGMREVGLSLEAPVRAEDAFAAVLDKFPALKKHKLLFARNQEYTKGDEPIADGDELAIFTPVSGG